MAVIFLHIEQLPKYWILFLNNGALGTYSRGLWCEIVFHVKVRGSGGRSKWISFLSCLSLSPSKECGCTTTCLSKAGGCRWAYKWSQSMFPQFGPDLYFTACISAHVGGTEKLYKDETIVWYPPPIQYLRNFLWDPTGCYFLVAMCWLPCLEIVAPLRAGSLLHCLYLSPCWW